MFENGSIQSADALACALDDGRRRSEGAAALQSVNLANIIQYRLGHFDLGHDQAADDAISYGHMLRNVSRHFLQPMQERTRIGADANELRAAATAATKLAALCLAFADKATRHAARIATDDCQKENE